MPKNKGKGGKNENNDIKRELILKEDGQSYAQVTRILGNGHIEAFCLNKISILFARELKRIHEIPDNVNITETSTNNNDGFEDVIFDDRHNSEESSDEEELSKNINNRTAAADSLSEDDSNDNDG